MSAFSANNGDLAWMEHYPAGASRGLVSRQESFRLTAANKTGKEWGSVLNFDTGDAQTG
jgi:hypothetical protein